MADPVSTALLVQECLDRLRAGEQAALDPLIRHTGKRLEELARHMLRGFPGVHRWVQTDDVLQNAMIRLLRALRSVQPESPRAFFGLATEQLRRELIDLARHYFGPEGLGANHASHDPEAAVPPFEKADLSHEPGSLAEWSDLHRQIVALPAEEREVVGLLFYQGLSQPDAAGVLGVAVRTVQRRWQSALLQLYQARKGAGPGMN